MTWSIEVQGAAMKGVELRSVKALVVARARELAQSPQFLSALVVFGIAWPLGSTLGLGDHRYIAVFTLLAAEWGWLTARWAGAFGRVRWAEWDTTGARLHGDALRGLPTSAGERVLATALVGALLASPTAVTALLFAVMAAPLSRLTPTSTVPLAVNGSVYVVTFALGIAWNRSRDGRVRTPFMRPLAWLTKLRPSHGSETSSATWLLVPGVLMSALITLAILVMWVLAMPGDFAAEVGATPGACALAVGIPCLRALMGISWLQMVVAPLARLTVSRRSLAWAELRLAPMRLIVSGVLILAVVPGLVRDAALAQTLAQLLVLATCVDAAVCVGWARIVMPQFRLAPMWLTYSTMAIFGATAFLAALVLVWVPASVAALIIDAIAGLSLLLAALLAYTAPTTPLSTSPFRTDWFAFLRRSSAPPRGK